MRTLLGLGLLAAAMTACGSPSTASHRATVRIVASSDVWGDIASQIGGSAVDVTSVIDNPTADPHSFQATARDQLAVRRARIVIENGGGYDDFMTAMVKDAPATSLDVINAVGLSGHRPVDGELNEHVWYDFPTVRTVADRLVDDLVAADPAHAGSYRSNGTAFDRGLQMLEAHEARIRAAHAGAGLLVTEPVPLYMTAACGLVDRTPPAFSQSIEEGTDTPPRVLAQTLELVRHRDVQLLAYNAQTSGPQTEKLVAAARSAGVAVVSVTETLPRGRHYLAWMAANLTAIDGALSA